MKPIYQYSFEEIKDFYINYNQQIFDCSLRDFYDVIIIKKLSNNIIDLSQAYLFRLNKNNIPVRTITIHFNSTEIISYTTFSVINNQITNVLSIFYKIDLKLNDKYYIVESTFDPSDNFVCTDIYLNKYDVVYNDNCFYNPEEIPKIISNLVFL